MPDYGQSKIYCIRSFSTDAIYVGSTTLPLCQRIAKHKYEYKRWFNGKTDWCSSYLLLGFGDAYIELVEDYPCNSKDQLNRREGEIIRATPNCVNHCIAGQTRQEYKKTWNNNNQERLYEYYKNRQFGEGRERYLEYLRTYHAKKKLAHSSDEPSASQSNNT